MRKHNVLFVMGILLFASVSFAQESKPMDCNAMMQKMHSGAKAMDDRLQALVDEMNKAKRSAKTDKTAAVINELVTQRKQMREQMMTMMPQMMGHMMEHLQSGMMSGMKHSMSDCPMMKGAPAAAAEHKH
ncbi:MAG TPA: hypothetical protein VMS98_15805 [Thermoanaerobaculia bacterium]|nr:hypothetical protein [Thermoanaerobaculia bacterium]